MKTASRVPDTQQALVNDNYLKLHDTVLFNSEKCKSISIVQDFQLMLKNY